MSSFQPDQAAVIRCLDDISLSNTSTSIGFAEKYGANIWLHGDGHNVDMKISYASAAFSSSALVFMLRIVIRCPAPAPWPLGWPEFLLTIQVIIITLMHWTQVSVGLYYLAVYGNEFSLPQGAQYEPPCFEKALWNAPMPAFIFGFMLFYGVERLYGNPFTRRTTQKRGRMILAACGTVIYLLHIGALVHCFDGSLSPAASTGIALFLLVVLYSANGWVAYQAVMCRQSKALMNRRPYVCEGVAKQVVAVLEKLVIKALMVITGARAFLTLSVSVFADRNAAECFGILYFWTDLVLVVGYMFLVPIAAFLLPWYTFPPTTAVGQASAV